MKSKILSTGFSLIIALALFLPAGHSFVNAGDPAFTRVNVTGTCIQINTKDGKSKVCDGGFQRRDVSWNSGGG